MTIKKQVLKLHDQKYSVNQISQLTGLTNKQIRSVYNKHKGLYVNRYDKIEVNEELEQFLYGSILGDGSFTKPYVSNTSRLSIAHCIDQKNWINYKHDLLKKFNLSGKLNKNRINSSRYKNGYAEEYRFKSLTHPIFYDYGRKYYKNGNKIVDEKYVSKLKPFAIAIWFMDDGNVTSYGFQFNTQSFSIKEKKILQSKLKKFDINTTLHKQGQIYILSESRNAFINLIKNHIHNDFNYKLVPYNLRS